MVCYPVRVLIMFTAKRKQMKIKRASQMRVPRALAVNTRADNRR